MTQKLTGHVRAAIDKYKMISPGDRIAVGVSGGKDSMFLLSALSELQRYYPVPFTLTAVTIDPGFYGKEADYSQIEDFCRQRSLPYILRRSQLAHIVFEENKESSPCSLCARMRRGMLHNLCVENGLNKIALGHHMDDAVETFFMNLLYGGKIGSFSPVTYLSRKKLTMIRPLIFCAENDIRNAAKREHMPIVKSECPVDGVTARQDTKQLLTDLEKSFPDLKAKILGAMQRSGIDRWSPEQPR